MAMNCFVVILICLSICLSSRANVTSLEKLYSSMCAYDDERFLYGYNVEHYQLNCVYLTSSTQRGRNCDIQSE